ncbi:site-specific integrase [Clostridium botulinum]|uniref:site-specific integrase n=1 Tax=Clostridium botulinum TaxID=1491 RepID=UPI0004D5405E|nr:site-specific integrase [Clostridium botulinum]KEI04338.1 hypothetical protein Z952_07195 [Clostridium botulinum C/D str. BKT75002]KEI09334.1 hypothetical protein Z954_13205 [Clostridium botulinum C/D str. BKT2873]
MSKRQSVVHQAVEVLKKIEAFGTKRHGDKKNAINNKLQYDTYTKSKIYSYNTFKHTQNTVIPFVKFCREQYGIKYLLEIKPEYFTEFIKRGNATTGEKYEKNTAATYATHIKKFENGFNKILGTNLKFYTNDYKNYVQEDKQVKKQMPRQVHDKIIDRAYSTSVDNGRALELARNLGLRVGEITKLKPQDFKFKNDGKLDKVHIHKSKGGKSRDISAKSLTTKQSNKVVEIYKHYSNLRPEENIFKNKAESYGKAFSRCRNWIISNSRDKKEDYEYCGVHSMRKEFAQDFYEREVEENGRDEREVKEELTEILGHNRLSVLDAYLKSYH